MKLGQKGATFYSLPPNMQTPENYAMGIAIDRQMDKLMKFFRKMIVWADIGSVDEKYYGYLAASIRALYYSPEHDKQVRLGVLQEALKTYMYAGSMEADGLLIGKLFPGAVFVPWFEYGGEPYHFKIVVPTDPTEDTLNRFVGILSRVKAKRSIIDRIETTTYHIKLSVDVAGGLWSYEKLREEIT